MKLRNLRQIRYYLPPGIQSKINRQTQSAGVAVMHTHRGKIVKEHHVREKCERCVFAQVQD